MSTVTKYSTHHHDGGLNMSTVTIYRITGYLCEHSIYVNMLVKLKLHKYNSHNLYIQRKIIWYK